MRQRVAVPALSAPLALLLATVACGAPAPASAQPLGPGASYVLEATGFAAGGAEAAPSGFELVLVVGAATADTGRAAASIGGGLVTLGGEEYMAADMTGTSLRGGKLLRISGTAVPADGGEGVTLGVLGRLAHDGGADGGASLYALTGRITEHDGTRHDVLYVARASGLRAAPPAPAPAAAEGDAPATTIRILPGSSERGRGATYADQASQARTASGAGYVDPDRLSVEPGTPFVISNGDSVAHTLASGSGSSSTTRGAFVLCEGGDDQRAPGSSYVQSDCSYTLDGRVNTGPIPPGGEATVVLEEAGFYRMIDPDYPWITITAYSFPASDSQIIRHGSNPHN